MSEIKCPRCGADAIKQFRNYSEFACRSDIGGNGPDTFWQSVACKNKEKEIKLDRLTTLERKLEEARKWMEHKPYCPWFGLSETTTTNLRSQCTCGLAAFLSTLEGGKEG